MIAILGPTGYIGSGIARVLAERSEGLSLFCREPAKLATRVWPANVTIEHIDHFNAAGFELIINCIGAGTPERVATLGSELMSITQFWDERILSTMAPDACYVFLSSGAVYGAFSTPPSEASTLCLEINRLTSVPPYTAAKLCAELRHRHLPGNHILDLRIFGYADRAVPLEGGFFLSELVRSVLKRVPLVTSPADMVRDYVGVVELVALIDAWRADGAPNGPLDCYSSKFTTKMELIAMAIERYDIEVRVSEQSFASTTGLKPFYGSSFKAAASIGYEPQRASAEIVLEAIDARLTQFPS